MTFKPALILATIGAFTASAPSEARDRYQAFCDIAYGMGENIEYVALTEVFETDLSIDDVTYQMGNFLYDVNKGRVQVAFETSGTLRAYCVGGGSDVRQNRANYIVTRGDAFMTIKSPLDYRGYYRRNSASSTKAPSPKSVPVAAKSVSEPSTAAPKGPTPNQLKYQRELVEHQARLAEIERIKAATAAKHAVDRAAAGAELARHQQEKATADAARRTYEADLAAHQRLIDQRQTAQDRERKVDWREAVIVCNLDPKDGQSQFGNWRCDGPLQMTYAKLGSSSSTPSAKELVSLSQACGGKPESVRDLGVAGTSRLFGCSFGLHPKSTGGFPLDAALKHGVSFIAGRAIYRCPEYVSACRTQ